MQGVSIGMVVTVTALKDYSAPQSPDRVLVIVRWPTVCCSLKLHGPEFRKINMDEFTPSTTCGQIEPSLQESNKGP